MSLFDEPILKFLLKLDGNATIKTRKLKFNIQFKTRIFLFYFANLRSSFSNKLQILLQRLNLGMKAAEL